MNSVKYREGYVANRVVKITLPDDVKGGDIFPILKVSRITRLIGLKLISGTIAGGANVKGTICLYTQPSGVIIPKFLEDLDIATAPSAEVDILKLHTSIKEDISNPQITDLGTIYLNALAKAGSNAVDLDHFSKQSWAVTVGLQLPATLGTIAKGQTVNFVATYTTN